MRISILDTGVLSNSFMDFMNVSDFAERALYYATRVGHFYCDQRYRVERDYLDLYLLFFVCQGTLCIESHDKTWTVEKNQIALLDCHYPHTYYSTGNLEFLWIHYNGCSSDAYGKLLHDRSGVVFTGSHISGLRKRFDTIIESVQSYLQNEHYISVNLHRLLSHLAASDARAEDMDGMLQPAIQYISEHYASHIDLDLLASLCNLSTAHLIRRFKQLANATPHQFLLSFRLRKSKQLLLTTSLPIDEIAELCGFHSASHFARAFRAENAMSPSMFRTLRF